MEGHAEASEIIGRGAGDQLHLADPPRDQALIREFAGPDRAVEILGGEIGGSVAEAEIELDVRVTGMEPVQRRDDDRDRQGRAAVHAQPAARAGLGERHAGVELVEFAEKPVGAFVVGGSIHRHRDAPRRAIEEFCPQMRLELLNLLGQGRFRDVEQLRGAGEGAGLDDLTKARMALS